MGVPSPPVWMTDRHLSRRGVLAAATGIATAGVALGSIGGDGLSVAVTEHGAEETAVTATLPVDPGGRERTSIPTATGRYTVAVTVGGDALRAVDLAADGTRTLGLA